MAGWWGNLRPASAKGKVFRKLPCSRGTDSPGIGTDLAQGGGQEGQGLCGQVLWSGTCLGTSM